MEYARINLCIYHTKWATRCKIVIQKNKSKNLKKILSLQISTKIRAKINVQQLIFVNKQKEAKEAITQQVY